MRVKIIEYSEGVSLDEFLSDNYKLKDLIVDLSDANRRITKELKTKKEVLVVSGGYVRALGIAGIIKLNAYIDIEIVPKFLDCSTDEEWKTTLYLLSAISKHGSVMVSERVRASSSYKESLYSIAAHILADEYLKHRRSMIRTYHKVRFTDFSIQGDIDFSTIFERNPDGIEQSRMRFDRLNAYNSTIKAAMTVVRPYALSQQTQNVLTSAITEFGPQEKPSRRELRVPPRNKEWKPSYELAYEIITGKGNSFEEGEYSSLGFVVDTWRVWQWLLTVGMQIRTHEWTVFGEPKIDSGFLQNKQGVQNVTVAPDVQIFGKKENGTLFLIDAKYKLIESDFKGEILRSDLYEAYAFCNACNVDNIYLAYPDTDEGRQPGEVRYISKYVFLNKNIIVIKVAFGAMKNKGGIFTFAENLQKGVLDLEYEASE